MGHKTDITDLIPKGLGAYWLFFVGGVLSIGVLEFAYRKMPALSERIGMETIPPLDISQSSSLMNWGVSILLFVCAGVALMNYRLGRKHGDSVGRTATWFWAAFALVFLSMEMQVAFRETFRAIMITVSGATLYGNGTVWWLAVYTFFLAVIGTRLLIDLSGYAPALGFFLLAVAGGGCGLLLELEMLPLLLDKMEMVMLQTGVVATSTLFLFLSMTLFARRQVFRDPEIALRWFAKVWNQSALLQSIPKDVSVSATPVAAPSSPVPVVAPVSPAVSSTTKPVVAVKPVIPVSSTISNPSPSSTSTVTSTGAGTGTAQSVSTPAPSTTRPVVQKTTGVVPFRPAQKSSKDSTDFELTG